MGRDGRGNGRVTFEAIVGQSPAIPGVCEIVPRVAAGDSTVLIQGDSGTGQELFARAIHGASRRAAGPFVPVNCGAIPEGRLESELFGYERGAFTGADPRGKPGKLELGDGGTLFLDETAAVRYKPAGQETGALGISVATLYRRVERYSLEGWALRDAR